MATQIPFLCGATKERKLLLARIVAPVVNDIARSEEVLARNLASQYAYVNALLQHVERFKGKQLRPALLHLAARAFGGEAPLAFEVAAVVEMVHLASLCHDDVLDDAETRRNGPTVRAMWGNKSAILTGDVLFSRALEALGKLDDTRPLKVLSHACRLICEGELLQIDGRYNTDLEEDAYFDMIEKKTAVLFGAAAELGAMLAGATEEESRRLYAYGRRIGLAFQIVDDCLDLTGVEESAGKSLGSDLRNGEYTLPIIHMLANTAGPARQQVLALLRTQPGPSRDEVAPYLERTGSLEYALQTARAEIRRARDEVAFLPPSVARRALVDVPEYILGRVS